MLVSMNCKKQRFHGNFKIHIFYLVDSSTTSKTTASSKETSVGNDSHTNVSESSPMENRTTDFETKDPVSETKDPEEDSTEDYDYTKDNVQDEDSNGN